MAQRLLVMVFTLACGVKSQRTLSDPPSTDFDSIARLHAHFSLPNERPAPPPAKAGVVVLPSANGVCPICGPIDTRTCKKFKLCDLSGGYRLVPYSGKFIPGIFNDSIAKSLQEDCPDPQTLFSILSDFQLVTGNRETVTKKGHSEAVPDILGYDLVFKDKRRAASAACWKGMVRPCLPNPILHTFTNAGSINKRGNVVNARPVERIIKP
eukprot:5231987-Pyramimonas_sp.AAC.2